MDDLKALTTLASDKTPFTDLGWRKELLKKIQAPAAKPFVNQALAAIKEMEAGIRSSSPFFTRDHAREARSRIRTALSQAVDAIQHIEVSDKLMDEIAEGSKKIDGSQTSALKLYKGVPVTVTNLWGQDLNKLKQLLRNTDIQGYPVFMNQMLIGINLKRASKLFATLDNQDIEFSDHILGYFARTDKTGTVYKASARETNLMKLLYAYKNATPGTRWEPVSGQPVWKNGVGYVWVAATEKLAAFIGNVVEGSNREWSVATFASSTKSVPDAFAYKLDLIETLFDKAKRMKQGPDRRINYDALATRYKIPVDVVRGILDGKIQTEDTAKLAIDLKRWKA